MLLHFDVDVIDFTDTPLSENPGRNEGISYEQASGVRGSAGSPALAGLTVTELNPHHVEEERAASSVSPATSPGGSPDEPA